LDRDTLSLLSTLFSFFYLLHTFIFSNTKYLMNILVIMVDKEKAIMQILRWVKLWGFFCFNWIVLFAITHVIVHCFLRCINHERKVKYGHVMFQKRGLKFLDDLHWLFDHLNINVEAKCGSPLTSAL
jgi:hypothetical protein